MLKGISIRYLSILTSFVTFATFLPSLWNGFVNWDDGVYVYENKNIQSMGLEFFKWSLTSVVASHWHPLTMLSFAFDNAIWELSPFGYHFTNAMLHILNTILVLLLTFRLSANINGPYKKAIIAAVITALLFGIHPLHVESVAWVSERKDVLYAFFYLLSLLAYLQYIRGPRRPVFYTACLASFVISLLSKPMAVSLPVVLLILDFYPLNRLKERKFKRVLIEKLPFLLLSLITSLIAISTEQSGGALKTLEAVPFITRILVAGHALIFYLTKMVIPFNLAPFYPHPAFHHIEVDFFTMEYLGSNVLLAAISLFCVLSRNRLLLAVWLYYIVTLLPVIGVFQVGGHAAADRYTYLPSLGPFLLAGLCVGTAFERFPKGCKIIAGTIILLSGVMISRTIEQISIWRDSITLWNHEIRLFPNAYMAYHNRGMAHEYLGNHKQALNDYDRAIELKPNFIEIYINRGTLYGRLGNYQRAINDLKKAIDLKPSIAITHNNLGNVYYSMGDYAKAISSYSTAIKLDPGYGEAYYNLALTYSRIGERERSLIYYKKAATLGMKGKEDVLTVEH